MNYGEKLKKLRLSKNLTQSNIANNLGISQVTYSHYEVQEKIIPLERLNDLINYFDVSFDYILGLNNIIKYSNNKTDIDREKAKNNLKNLRKEFNLTQKKLADILNTTQSVIAEYERGRFLIALPFLYTICTKYNISGIYQF